MLSSVTGTEFVIRNIIIIIMIVVFKNNAVTSSSSCPSGTVTKSEFLKFIGAEVSPAKEIWKEKALVTCYNDDWEGLEVVGAVDMMKIL